MGKILKYFAVLLLFCLLLPVMVSCNDLGCLDNRSSIPLAKLYASGNLAIPKAITLDSITVYGVGQKNDSLLIDSAMRVAEISFPFRNNLDSSQFVIQYNYTWNIDRRLNDTLTFFYQPYVFFASLECGSMFNYTLDSVRFTTNQLDSVRVLTNEITNQNVANFQIFYPASR